MTLFGFLSSSARRHTRVTPPHVGRHRAHRRRGGHITVSGAFALFTCVSASQFVLTFLFLPETKGKTLEEIEAFLAFGVAEQGARGGYNRVVNENAA